jgi:hypothetical protein
MDFMGAGSDFSEFWPSGKVSRDKIPQAIYFRPSQLPVEGYYGEQFCT